MLLLGLMTVVAVVIVERKVHSDGTRLTLENICASSLFSIELGKHFAQIVVRAIEVNAWLFRQVHNQLDHSVSGTALMVLVVRAQVDVKLRAIFVALRLRCGLHSRRSTFIAFAAMRDVVVAVLRRGALVSGLGCFPTAVARASLLHGCLTLFVTVVRLRCWVTIVLCRRRLSLMSALLVLWLIPWLS